MDDCSYEVSFQDGDKIYTANLKLSFAGGSISSLTDGVTATGTCSWGDDTEKKAWGNRDRDGMELNYTITFADGKSFSKQEKLVWQRSGVKPVDEFTPVYKK